ncbi:hypothetical protein MFRU_009g02440 [Monilinia fructicola]|nr:hypothetical protein MFRU_009g02440 [Monilinia fructicola]
MSLEDASPPKLDAEGVFEGFIVREEKLHVNKKHSRNETDEHFSAGTGEAVRAFLPMPRKRPASTTGIYYSSYSGRCGTSNSRVRFSDRASAGNNSSYG